MIFNLDPVGLLSPLSPCDLVYVLAYCELPNYRRAFALSPFDADYNGNSNVFSLIFRYLLYFLSRRFETVQLDDDLVSFKIRHFFVISRTR